MSRRQALGVISNNFVNNGNNGGAVNNLKQSNSTVSLKQSTCINNNNGSSSCVNNENEPRAWPSAASVISNAKKQMSSAEFEFEIFQEELSDLKIRKSSAVVAANAAAASVAVAAVTLRNSNKKNQDEQEDGESVLAKFAAKHGYVEKKKESLIEKENKLNDQEEEEEEEEKKKPVVFSNDDNDEECDDDDDEEEEYDYYNQIEDLEEEEDDDDDDDEEDDEEEGISRLNACVSIETNQNKSDLVSMMDSSRIDQSSSSPMVLDDTIKFQSIAACSSYEEYQDCQDDEEEENDDDQNDDESLLVNCNEYKDEVLAHLRKMELENRPKPNYMRKQQDITSSMRSILVDWLVEVSEEYRLNLETLYLAVNYTDRFLSQMSVLRGKLQLIGTACIYIASKYEEISPPDVSEFVYITDDTYTKKQVLRMEHLLLKVLDFRMTTPTANCFLSHYLRALKYTTNRRQSLAKQNEPSYRIENLARYLAELTLIDADTFLNYLPSQIAASAIYLSMQTLGKPWTKQVAETIGYNHDLSELKNCIVDMHKCMLQAPNHAQQAIQEKYNQSKYNYASKIEALKSLPF